jgi:5-methyltetrahydropteroyltriglutamate--homocysteine methyltransferase
MKWSTTRILTTHTGSLPRPPRLAEMVQDRAIGEAVDLVALEDTTRGAVTDIVRQQVETGIDAVSDGELSKISFANYVAERLSGLGDASDVTSPSRWGRDMEDFPGLTQRAGGGGGRRGSCTAWAQSATSVRMP